MLDTHSIIKDKKPVRVNNTVIGYIQNSQFIKSVDGSKHMLRCPPAWAIDAEAFDNEIKSHVSEIIIQDRETGNRYITSVLNFDKRKKAIERGFGKQYYLPLSDWKVEQSNSQQLNLLGWRECL
jgi:hypothetical protein